MHFHQHKAHLAVLQAGLAHPHLWIASWVVSPGRASIFHFITFLEQPVPLSSIKLSSCCSLIALKPGNDFHYVLV